MSETTPSPKRIKLDVSDDSASESTATNQPSTSTAEASQVIAVSLSELDPSVATVPQVRLGESLPDYLRNPMQPISLDLLHLGLIGSGDDTLSGYLSLLSLFSTVGVFRQCEILSPPIQDIKYAYSPRPIVAAGAIYRVLQSIKHTIPRHLRIGSLLVEADSAYPAMFCELLRRTESIHSLRNINVNAESLLDLGMLSLLLHDVSSTLTHLTFDPESMVLWQPASSASSNPWEKFHFPSLVSLESLTLRLRMKYCLWLNDGTYNRAISNAAFDIVSLCPNTLRQLTMIFDFDLINTSSIEDHTHFDWSRLRTLLYNLPDLEKLSFIFKFGRGESGWYDELLTEWKRIIRDNLPEEAVRDDRLLVLQVSFQRY